MNKTEKLKEKIARTEVGNVYDSGKRVGLVEIGDEAATQILQDCKEAGLKFIPEGIANAWGERPTWFENVEEIEL